MTRWLCVSTRARARHSVTRRLLIDLKSLLHRPLGEDQNEWLDRLEQEVANLRTALDALSFAEEPDEQLGMTVALRHFWRLHGHLSEGRQRLDQALARKGRDGALSAQALGVLGLIAYYQGDYANARSYLEENLALSMELGLVDRVASGLSDLGMIARAEGGNRSAQSLYEESLRKARKLNDPVLMAHPIHNLADLALEEGAYDRAQQLATEALALWRQVGDKEGVALSLVNLGLVAIHLDETKAAAGLLRKALAAAKELGSPIAIAACLDGFAAIAVRHNMASEAAQLLGVAHNVRRSISAVAEPSEQKLHEGTMSLVTSHLPSQELADALARAQSMAVDEAIWYALAPTSQVDS